MVGAKNFDRAFLMQSVELAGECSAPTNQLIPILLMDNELLLFLTSVGLLILYLILSAITEMGTKLPWKK
ncbi:MAG: hypothetical protein FWK01_10525 [Pantanalinema sp. GBBB05]|nr:hypothetical protein [Pantanalinema sp. GBBB05]